MIVVVLVLVDLYVWVVLVMGWLVVGEGLMVLLEL